MFSKLVQIMNILIISANGPEFDEICNRISSLIKSCSHVPFNWDDDNIYDSNKRPMQNIEDVHNKIDILIAYTPKASYGVFVEIGHAIAKKIPVITLCSLSELDKISFEQFSDQNIIFDPLRIEETLLTPLKNLLSVDTPLKFIENSKKNEKLNVFVSYSHNDIEYLERLKIHVKPLEKKGVLDFWSDTKIKSGSKWEDSIEVALEKAAVALLLISADFLASDFIVGNELPPLLNKAEEKGLVILPIVVKPCRFKQDENLSRFQCVNNPTIPLSKMLENDREELYVKVVDSIEGILNLKK